MRALGESPLMAEAQGVPPSVVMAHVDKEIKEIKAEVVSWRVHVPFALSLYTSRRSTHVLLIELNV
jgi:hypothetical protein